MLFFSGDSLSVPGKSCMAKSELDGGGEGREKGGGRRKRKRLEIVQSCEESLIENLNRNDASYVSLFTCLWLILFFQIDP